MTRPLPAPRALLEAGCDAGLAARNAPDPARRAGDPFPESSSTS